jgi:hypothetical protein
MQTPEEIREDLDALLKPPLAHEEWELCVDEGYVERIAENPTDIRRVVQRLRKLRRTYGGPAASRTARKVDWKDWTPDGETEGMRLRAITELLVSDAERFDPVREFREKHLAGRLLDPADELENWLWDSWVKETEADACPSCRQYLTYIGGSTDDIERLPYNPKGTLHELHLLTASLHDRYGWNEAECTNFILCGQYPFAADLEIQNIEREPFGAASRIVMTIDPALSPYEVSQRYAVERERVMSSRYRSLDQKHLTLAWLHASQRDFTWPKQMEMWNEKVDKEGWGKSANEDWHYRDNNLFRRDTRASVGRVLRAEASAVDWNGEKE